jgi:hypothetical protein
MTTHVPPSAAGKGGRPKKFTEPSRPVTVTLPLRVLDRLAAIDPDRAKAIVLAADTTSTLPAPSEPPVRELPVSDSETLIAIADSPLLRTIPWLTLIQVAPNRHLLSLRPGVPAEKLEVTIGDLLDANPDAPAAELELLRLLLDHLRTPRRNRAVRSESILVIQKHSSKR